MRGLLAISLLIAGLNANSDNSLSKLLGMGGMDMWLNLEQHEQEYLHAQVPHAEVPHAEVPHVEAPHAEAYAEGHHSNAIEDAENKITFTRHGADYPTSDSEEESEDDCPTCFEEIGEGLTQEWGVGDKRHSHYKKHADDIWGNRGNPHHQKKHGVGESVMSPDHIRSETGHGGRSSFGPGGSRGRGFSFNTDDMRLSPTARHFETKGHRMRNGFEDEFQERDAEVEHADEQHRRHSERLGHATRFEERHRAYEDSYLVLQQSEEPAEVLEENEAQQMDFYLDNGLLKLAQQIAQDQKDLYAVEELQSKTQKETNSVVRRDFTEHDDVESAEEAANAANANNSMVCDGKGICHENSLATAGGVSSKDALALQTTTLLAVVTALAVTVF